MVTTKMSEATAIVEDGGEIRKVAVQINILRIGPTAGPSIELMALNVKSHKNGLSKSYNIYISLENIPITTVFIYLLDYSFTCKVFLESTSIYAKDRKHQNQAKIY